MAPIADVGPASIVRGDAEPGAQLTGRFDILHEFRSLALGTTRRVSIYLPPGYDDSTARYPVLYLQDGQNLFDPGPRVRAGAGLGPRRDGRSAHRSRRDRTRDPGRHRSRRRRPPRRVHAEPRSAAACRRSSRRLSPHAGRRAQAVDRRPLPDARGSRGHRRRRVVAGRARRARARADAARRVRTRGGAVAVAVVASASRARSCARSRRPSGGVDLARCRHPRRAGRPAPRPDAEEHPAAPRLAPRARSALPRGRRRPALGGRLGPARARRAASAVSARGADPGRGGGPTWADATAA